MRKHGWQLPYHPLQVVAIAVFLALGFAFYVFFLPFVGKKVLQYVVLGMYTPLAICAFSLYICCAATNPVDPGVFKSKKYFKEKRYRKGYNIKDSREEGLITEVHTAKAMNKLSDEIKMDVTGGSSSERIEKSSELKTSEDSMFYCCLCEVEVRKHSKHCRVCDKCVDHFDHHCRWLNNCIGRKNYVWFFVLMISAILLLILQWSIGVLVLILCFLDRKRYSAEIMSKLGSSFSLAPFTVVVASCTFLAMLATLPLTQLLFFHVLLIKKGISTYEYIVALREQEQQGIGQQSPRMSSVSSITGFSSASSFNAFQRGSWCTPPRLFLEDESDAIPQEINIAVNSDTKKMAADIPRNRSAGNFNINPWTLARLNPEEASNAAARARKKSKNLQPIVTKIGRTNLVPKPEKERRLPEELSLGSFSRLSVGVISNINGDEISTEATGCLPPLQLEARSAFRSNRASSPDSSLDSPHLHPFRIASLLEAEEPQATMSLASAGVGAEMHRGVELLRSSSDGYEASGGEDSDIVPSRIVQRSGRA